MDFSVNRAELAEALAIVCSVVPQRTPKDILKGVLMDVHKDYAVLSATDLEIGIRLGVSQLQVDKPGTFLIDADKITQIVRESEEEVLRFEIVEEVCHVHGEGSHFQVYTMDTKAFPPVADVCGDADFEIEADVLRRISQWTVFAAARENTRYAINGVLWDKKGEELNLVATDGRRLSKASCKVAGQSKDSSAIVGAKAMQLFGRVLGEAGTKVAVRISANQIQLKAGPATVTAALLEGHFPRYGDVIPDDVDKKVEFDTQVLLSAVRRAALLTNAESKGVRLSFTRGKLSLSSRAPEQGEALIELDIDYNGDELAIGFNPLFLTDVLRVVATDRVSFEFKEPNRPGLFRSGKDLLYVVMPVNLA